MASYLPDPTSVLGFNPTDPNLSPSGSGSDVYLGSDPNSIFGPGGVASGDTSSTGGGFNLPAAGAGLNFIGSQQQQQAVQAALQQMMNMGTNAYNTAAGNLNTKFGTFGNQAMANLGNIAMAGAGGPTDIFNQSIAKQAGGNPAMIASPTMVPGTGQIAPGSLGTPPVASAPAAPAAAPAPTPTLTGNAFGQLGAMLNPTAPPGSQVPVGNATPNDVVPGQGGTTTPGATIPGNKLPSNLSMLASAGAGASSNPGASTY